MMRLVQSIMGVYWVLFVSACAPNFLVGLDAQDTDTGDDSDGSTDILAEDFSVVPLIPGTSEGPVVALNHLDWQQVSSPNRGSVPTHSVVEMTQLQALQLNARTVQDNTPAQSATGESGQNNNVHTVGRGPRELRVHTLSRAELGRYGLPANLFESENIGSSVNQTEQTAIQSTPWIVTAIEQASLEYRNQNMQWYWHSLTRPSALRVNAQNLTAVNTRDGHLFVRSEHRGVGTANYFDVDLENHTARILISLPSQSIVRSVYPLPGSNGLYGFEKALSEFLVIDAATHAVRWRVSEYHSHERQECLAVRHYEQVQCLEYRSGVPLWAFQRVAFDRRQPDTETKVFIRSAGRTHLLDLETMTIEWSSQLDIVKSIYQTADRALVRLANDDVVVLDLTNGAIVGERLTGLSYIQQLHSISDRVFIELTSTGEVTGLAGIELSTGRHWMYSGFRRLKVAPVFWENLMFLYDNIGRVQALDIASGNVQWVAYIGEPPDDLFFSQIRVVREANSTQPTVVVQSSENRVFLIRPHEDPGNPRRIVISGRLRMPPSEPEDRQAIQSAFQAALDHHYGFIINGQEVRVDERGRFSITIDVLGDLYIPSRSEYDSCIGVEAQTLSQSASHLHLELPTTIDFCCIHSCD